MFRSLQAATYSKMAGGGGGLEQEKRLLQTTLGILEESMGPRPEYFQGNLRKPPRRLKLALKKKNGIGGLILSEWMIQLRSTTLQKKHWR